VQETTPAFLDRREHALDNRPEMIDGKPCFGIMFVCSERDDPGWFAFGVASRIFSEAEVGRPVFIDDKLTVISRGECFVSQDISEFRKMFD